MADIGDSLVVVCEPIDDLATWRARTEAEFGAPTTVWGRDGDSVHGWGTALRLAFHGPDRLRDAAAAWRAVAASARIRDEVRTPGSGLVAFGAFSFADRSAADSVLVVPRLLVGVRDGRAYRTEVTGTGRVDAIGSVPSGTRAAFGDDAYRLAVDAAVARIAQGDLDKVVLARDAVLETTPGWSAPDALAGLGARYQEAWTFLVDGFAGASPETLVTTDGATMTARVLAGTAVREGDPTADAAARDALLGSAKNRFEHALAVDSLLRALADVVPALDLGRPFALGLPNVWHLATDASGRLARRSGSLDIVRALHPTAAVAGAPTGAALALIRDLEPFDRRRFAGPVGWIGADGGGEWAIGLRSAEIQSDGRLRAYAGAGIVGASDSVQELAETEWKFAPMREAALTPAAPAAASEHPQPAR